MNYNRFTVKLISVFAVVILFGLILSGCSSGGSDDGENVVETTSISGTVMIPAGNPVDQEVSFLGILFARAHAFEGDTPLKNAEIIIKDLANQKVLKTAVTDDKGKYTITGLKKGIDVIIIVTKEFKDGSKVRMSGIIPDIGQQTEIDGYIDAATTIFTEIFQYERKNTNLTDIDKDYIKARVERVEEVVQEEMDKNGGDFNIVVNNGIISENFGDGIKDEFLKQAVEEAYKKPRITEILDQNVNINEEIKIQVSAVDLDEDLINYDVEDLNSFEGATFINREFIWAPSQKGNYEITFIASDGTYTDEETISINVGGENLPPIATNDTASLNEDSSINIDLLANDNDPDGDNLSLTQVNNGTNGSIIDNGDGTVAYTPDLDFNGTDSFTYEISDGNGGTATANVNITINAVNDSPVLSLVGNKFINEGEILEFTVNASDVDGDSLNYSASGDLSSNFDSGNRTFSWTPTSSDVGTHNLTINVSDGELTDSETITISVGAVNQPPVANTDNETIDEDNSITLNVLTNDSDPDGDTLRLDNVNDYNSIGTVAYSFDGTVTYTPFPNYNGTDSFTYEISDGNGGTATGTVNLTINAVNDPPVLYPIGNKSTEENVELSFSIGFEDDDGDDIITTATGDLADYFNSGTQTFTWTPGYDDSGTYTLTIEVSDGTLTDSETITINVGDVNQPPVAVDDAVTTDEDANIIVYVLDNDSDPDGDIISFNNEFAYSSPNNGSVSIYGLGEAIEYKPDPDFNGEDSFTYTIKDSNGSTSTATINITINPINDLPVTTDDSATVDEDGTILIDVLANDTDIDGDTLSITGFAQGANGTVSQEGDSLRYTPDADFNGADSFTYDIGDGKGGIATATVDITVNSVNDLPLANDDSGIIDEDGTILIDVLINDTDVEGDTLSITGFTQGTNGTVAQEGDSLRYTPDADYNGADSFMYEISDGNGGIVNATVNITINPVNDLPVATNDSAVVLWGQSVNINVLENDSDVDGDTLTIQSFTQGQNGNVTQSGETLIYNHSDGISDSFNYTIIDNMGGIATAEVTISATE